MERFISCISSYNDANIVIVGYPYEGTSSFRPGSRFGPSAIRSASYGLETYSPYIYRDISKLNICDLGNKNFPFGLKKKVLKLIEKTTNTLLSDNKKILSLGGEHLISYPIMLAYKQKYPDIIVLHFDAHSDMRDEYLGETKSHATVLRRIFDIVGDKKIYQFGIRSGNLEELEFAKEHCYFYPFDLEAAKDAFLSLSYHTPIYLTIDLDVLDPSVLPGTGTPEPGGVSFIKLLHTLHLLKDYNVVGIDIVELAPDYDNSSVSSIVAAKLVRECLCLF